MPLPTDPSKHAYMFTDDIKFIQKIVILHPIHRDTFLAMKRPPTAKSRPNLWDLPGGNVLFGVTHIDSLLEEIREETGLSVTDIRPLLLDTSFDEVTGIYHLRVAYVGQAVDAKVILSHEHTEFRWVTKTEFLQLESVGFLERAVELL